MSEVSRAVQKAADSGGATLTLALDGAARGGPADVRLLRGDDGVIECRLHSGLLSNQFM
jgi:hypothetical protein